jgi:hypothetical protein
VAALLRLMFLTVLACSPAAAQDVSALLGRVAPTVVTISDDGAGQGSGFIASPDGSIVTNLHVIARMRAPRVTLASGESFGDVVVRSYDRHRDLAVLRIAATGLRAATLGNSDRAAVGQRVLALGSPRGLSGTITAGIVSAVRRHPSLPGATLLQTDAAINPGNSGGPLVNAAGEVVGVIVSTIRDAQSLGFAVPVNDLRTLLAREEGSYSLDEVRRHLLLTDWAAVVLPRRWRADSDFYLGGAAGALFELSGRDESLQLAFLRPAAEGPLGNRLQLTLQRQGAQYHGRASGLVHCETLRESRQMPWQQDAARLTVVSLERIELSFFAPSPPDPEGECRLGFKQFALALVPAGELEAPPPTGEPEYLERIRARRAEEQRRREQLRLSCRDVRAELAKNCKAQASRNAGNCKLFADIAEHCTREGL